MRAEIELPAGTELEKLKPISGYVLIIPREVPSRRIIVPDWHKHESCRGTVMAVADDEEELRPGQDVLFSPYSQRVLELNGNYLFMVHSSDVVALIVDAG